MSRFVPESEPQRLKEDDSSARTESHSEEEKSGGGAGGGGSMASSVGGRRSKRTRWPKQDDLGLTTNLGTVAWAAPEMLMGGGEYTAKVRGVGFGTVC